MSLGTKIGHTSFATNKSSIALNGSSNSSSLKRKRPPMIEIPNVLTEIPVDCLKLRSNSAGDCPDDGVICSSGFGVGLYSVKGKKKTMEDAHTFVSCPIAKKGFFGVYDGHGGSKAVQFVAEKLHGNINNMLEKLSDNRDKEEAVRQGYLKTDEDFLKKGVGSGACCVIALIEKNELIVSNVGDCRAVLCRVGTAEAITKDHRASQEEERKRIEDKGGYVEMHRGAWRVHGVLSVSRSIGDAHLKNWVPAEPDTKILPLTSDMEYLILASDGLWEQVGNQEAIDIVLRSCSVDTKLGTNVDTANVNSSEYHCISTSASPKSRRVLLIKQKKRLGHSPIYKKRISCCKEDDGCGSENESPPIKDQRMSLANHMKMKSQVPSQRKFISRWNENANDFGCENEGPPPFKARRISLLNQIKTRSHMSNDENIINQCKENANDFGCEYESPLPNSPKISVANKMKTRPGTPNQENSIDKRKENVADVASENDISSSKAQKVLAVNQMKPQPPQTPYHHYSIDEKRLTSGGLVAACKELVNLAVSRGTLDDITVMVIDLQLLKD